MEVRDKREFCLHNFAHDCAKQSEPRDIHFVMKQ